MRQFNISWTDLDFMAQENLKNEIIPEIMEECEKQGKEDLTGLWHEPKPKTWQEAYVRTMAIDFILWQDYEAGKTTEAPNWEDLLEENVSIQAEEFLAAAVSKLKLIVEL